MSKDVKVIRGQVRQVVKEVLPEVLESELIQKLREENERQLKVIKLWLEKHLNELTVDKKTFKV